MAGPQGLTPYQTYPGMDAWAENLRAGQAAAVANPTPSYQLDPSLVAARDAARLGVANANGVGQTIGATVGGVGKIMGAAGNLVSDYASAAGAAIRGFGADVATGYRGGPPPQAGGASGDWEGPAPVSIPNNAVAKVAAPAAGGTQFSPPTIDQGVAPQRAPRAAGSQPAATGSAPVAGESPAYSPVEIIKGLQRSTVYVPDEGVGPQLGSMPARGGGAGGGRFGLANPEGTIMSAFDRQQASNMAMADRLMEWSQGGNIFENKQRVAIAGQALAAMINNNNQGQVQGQGANSMNQVAGGIQSAGIGAGAQMYGANAGLQGNLASVAQRMYEAQTSSVPMGTEIGTDPVTGMGMPMTTYGQRPSAVGAMPTPYQQKPAFTPGVEYTNKGKRAVYQSDGTWKEVK
jgi:hypothetical protein